MINSNQRRLLLIFLLGIIFSLSGCKKELGEFLLGSYKSYNPLNGNETLVFVRSDGDTVLFYGQGRYSETYRYSENTYDYWINEWDNCRFATYDGKYGLGIRLITGNASLVMMTINFDERVGVDTVFNKIAHFGLPLEKTGGYYLDSLVLFEYHFNDVYVDTSLWGEYEYGLVIPHLETSANEIYYTKTEGIINIEFSDTTYMGLVEIQN